MHIERMIERTERQLGTADIECLICFQKKMGDPLRAVIPNGTETNIQLSLGESYLSLKIKASDSKQL